MTEKHTSDIESRIEEEAPFEYSLVSLVGSLIDLFPIENPNIEHVCNYIREAPGRPHVILEHRIPYLFWHYFDYRETEGRGGQLLICGEPNKVKSFYQNLLYIYRRWHVAKYPIATHRSPKDNHEARMKERARNLVVSFLALIEADATGLIEYKSKDIVNSFLFSLHTEVDPLFSISGAVNYLYDTVPGHSWSPLR